MPAIRNTVASVSQVSKVQILSLKNSGRPAQTTPTAEADSDASSLKAIDYPARDSLARATFIGENGKSVPSHHWAVYDFTFTIPSGKIMTYKDLCTALGSGSPRSVGSALRNNPFAPYIPCHRVIASNGFVGGYCGEWGPQGNAGGKMYNKKLTMLAEEGVRFNDKGLLVDRSCLWDGK